MNIDITCMQYVSAKSDEQKTCLTKSKYFDCDQKKTYVIFVMSLKISNKRIHSSFFHVVISCIMSSDELKNKLF